MAQIYGWCRWPNVMLGMFVTAIAGGAMTDCLWAKEPDPQQSEKHLKNIRQLTVGGKNAEAYFSFDGDRLIFQSTKDPEHPQLRDCYQMYIMNLDGTDIHRVSTGHGGTTCGYYFPGGRRVLYSSTHGANLKCPPKPERSARYRWMLDDYDIFSVRLDGQEMQRMTQTPGYDAEATIAPNGRKIVFTSVRDGDLDLYSMNIDGTGVKRLTKELGYDGGAFFSPDSRRIVYRSHHPKTPDEKKYYLDLLGKNLVEPSNLEIFIMNADGSNKLQVTSNGASNFSPFFHPDGHRIIFSSNLHQFPGGKGRPSFHLYLVNEDGTGVEQLTHEGNFNSFPMFSPDGKKLVWVSDHNAKGQREFNVFLADWVP